MNAGRMQRLAVVWIASAQVLWALCLVALWHWAADATGTATLRTAAALLLSLALCAPLPTRAARAFQRVLAWMKLQDLAAVQLATSGQRWAGGQDVRTMRRLLALTAGLSSAGGLLATGAVFVGDLVLDSLASHLTWDAATWSAAVLAVQVALLAPLAAAMALTFQAAAVLRHGGAEDCCATVLYDYGYAGAAGAGAFALLWLAGVNLLGVALMLAVLLPACVLPLLAARQGVVPPRRIDQPIERPSPAQGWWAAAEMGAVSVAVLVQLRLVGDATALPTAARAAWLALTLGAGAALMAWTDRRGGPEGRAATPGAWLAVVSAGLTQSALLAGAVVFQAGGQWAAALALLGLAGAGQGLFAGAAANLVARRRRAFARAAGRPSGYLAALAGGGGAGVAAYLALAAAPWGAMVLLAAALAVLAGAVLAGLGSFEQPMRQVRWAVSGAVLIGCLTVAMLVPMRQAGQIVRGAWLSAWAAPPGSPSVAPGLLPLAPAGEAGDVDALLETVLSGPAGRGQWLVGAWGEPALPTRDMLLTAAAPDVGAVPHGAWRRRLHGLTGNFLVGLRCGQSLYDGILIDLDAEAPSAWRWLNMDVLERCRRRLHETGLLVVRTRVRADRAGEMAPVLEGLHRTMGSGWATFEQREGRLHVLAVGWGEAASPPPLPAHARIAPLEDLLAGLGARPLRIWAPNAPARAMTAADWLDRLAPRKD